jgi:hypothetical protein
LWLGHFNLADSFQSTSSKVPALLAPIFFAPLTTPDYRHDFSCEDLTERITSPVGQMKQ